MKAERNLERVEKLIERFEPSILLTEHDFAADNVEKRSHALVEDEREEFGYKARDAGLVGLLDQRAHSGAAQVDLSVDRGTAAGGAPGAGRAVQERGDGEDGTNGGTW